VPLRGPNIPSLWPNDLVDRCLLYDVGRPACEAGESEGRRKQVRAQADTLKDGGGVELDICLDYPVGFQLGKHSQDGFLGANRKV
jgi:hypothetical protein